MTIEYTSAQSEEYFETSSDTNPFSDSETNPFTDSETNPFTDTESNPFTDTESEGVPESETIDPWYESDTESDIDIYEKKAAYKDLMLYIEKSQNQAIADESFYEQELNLEDPMYHTYESDESESDSMLK